MQRHTRARGLALVLALVVPMTFGGAPSAAATNPTERTVAASLYAQGWKLLEQNQVAEACAKLEASVRAHDALTSRELLARCSERLGRLATAYRHFRQAKVLAHREGRVLQAVVAERALRALEPRLARLTLAPPAKAYDGLVLRIDGEVVPLEQFGAVVPIDRGTYTIVAEAPGYQSWTIEVTIADGERKRVVIPQLRSRGDDGGGADFPVA